MSELNQTQINALKELKVNLELTKFNYYPKVKLYHKTGISNKDLYVLHNECLISRAKGIRDTLVILTEEGREYINTLKAQ